MKFPEEFLNEMNDFFSRYKYVPQEGFFESFEKEPLKGIRFSRTKINSADEEKQLLMTWESAETLSRGVPADITSITRQAAKKRSTTPAFTIPRSLPRCFLRRSWQQSPAR